MKKIIDYIMFGFKGWSKDLRKLWFNPFVFGFLMLSWYMSGIRTILMFALVSSIFSVAYYAIAKYLKSDSKESRKVEEEPIEAK
jgi:hypothetical protein